MAINLQQELTKLRRRVLTLGAQVEERFARVVTALVERDYVLARTVRHGDKPIDQMEVEIEEQCLRILALAQPVGKDLRFILAVLRINTELERIGDLAKSIAKRLLEIEHVPAFVPPPALNELAQAGLEMVRGALDALSDENAEKAQALRRADQRLDELQRDVLRWARLEIPAHVDATDGAINVLSITRSLERIGDLTTNIAEDLIFLVEGAVVRHRSTG